MSGLYADAPVQDLWTAYKETGDPAVREKLILNYLSVVKYIAKKIGHTLPSSVEENDLVSYGIFGLMDAIERFDPGRGFKFETYAMSRIRGAIIDELRVLDWVPRSVRSRARAIDNLTGSTELGRVISEQEASDILGYTSSQFQQMQTNLASSSVMPLDALLDAATRSNGNGDGATVGDLIPSPVDDPGQKLDFESLGKAMDSSIFELPERERMVLALYYYDGLTLAEIGATLGVTESRVCQIHTKACRSLAVQVNELVRG